MAVTTPAVPATTVPAANQTGQYVDVAVTGGTMTNVSIINQAGTSTTVGAGAGNYGLPPGCSIVMTYTVAPTWAWTDPLETGYAPTYSAANLALINEIGQLPYPAHAEGGETGLGEAVSN
jgi:hypothetical protein